MPGASAITYDYIPVPCLFSSFYQDVATGLLYVHGGYTPDLINQTFVLDLNQPWTVDNPPWRQLPDSPAPFDSAGMVVSPDGNDLIFFGGEQSFDPLLGGLTLKDHNYTWWYRNSSITNMKERITGLRPVADPVTGVFYIRGGYQSDKVDMLNIYDSVTPAHRGTLVVKPLPTGVFRAQWYSATWSSKRQSVLSFGGKFGAMSMDYAPNFIYEYSPSLDQWRILDTTGNAPTPREDACMVTTTDGKKLIVFGGQQYTTDDVIVLGDIYILDLETLEWKQGTTTPDVRVGMACASHEDAFITLMGSKDYLFYYAYDATPAIYNLTTDTWTTGYKTDPLPPLLVEEGKPDTHLGLIIGLTLGATALAAIVIGMFLYKREKAKTRERWRKYYAERSNRAGVATSAGDYPPYYFDQNDGDDGDRGTNKSSPRSDGTGASAVEAVANVRGVTAAAGGGGAMLKGAMSVSARAPVSKKNAEKHLGDLDDPQLLGYHYQQHPHSQYPSNYASRWARNTLEDDQESFDSTGESSLTSRAVMGGDDTAAATTRPRKSKRSGDGSKRRLREAVSSQKIELSPTPTNISGKIEESSTDELNYFPNNEYDYAPPRRKKQSSSQNHQKHHHHPREREQDRDRERERDRGRGREREREREREQERSRSRTRRRVPQDHHHSGGRRSEGTTKQHRPSSRKRVQSKGSGGDLRVKAKPAPGAEVDKSKFPYNPEYRAFDRELVSRAPRVREPSPPIPAPASTTVSQSPIPMPSSKPATEACGTTTSTLPHLHPAPPVLAEPDEMAPIKE
ncbi:hypothetical protein BGW42_000626 [Actinomortierella wolfii]|nr:hypothetical protein BGW42_000626 [Actinomortierella wolfii]